jgi:hypothetical protein
MRKKRIVAFCIALTVIACIAASVTLNVIESDHDCSGTHCHICELISICKTAVHFLATACAVRLFQMFRIIDTSGNNRYSGNKYRKYSSLFKIRLLN